MEKTGNFAVRRGTTDISGICLEYQTHKSWEKFKLYFTGYLLHELQERLMRIWQGALWIRLSEASSGLCCFSSSPILSLESLAELTISTWFARKLLPHPWQCQVSIVERGNIRRQTYCLFRYLSDRFGELYCNSTICNS